MLQNFTKIKWFAINMVKACKRKSNKVKVQYTVVVTFHFVGYNHIAKEIPIFTLYTLFGNIFHMLIA